MTALGFLLIGFGIGIIINKNLQIEENQYLLITIGSLILGGFFTALGIAKRVPKKEKVEEEIPEKEFALPESNLPEDTESPEESSFQ